VIPAFASTRLRWTPDGTRLAYVEPDMRTNIWTVPIAGGKPVQLTHFEERFIVDFDWSSDGKRLVVGRRLETNDIVVLKDLRRE
jgi:Tol biopolymer transport system component